MVSKLTIAAAILLCCVLVTNTFAQTTNATAGGIVSDTTGAVIPGVTVTAMNTQTGIVKQSGMRWTIRGANAVIALRCSEISGRWEEFWETRSAG